jgi:RNA polymerase sigma factor (sigma-70 family)
VTAPRDPPLRAAGAIGTEQLFRQLVSDHRTGLYRFVLRHIGRSDDAQDITQQAFVEASKSIESFRGDAQMSTWLYGIAMNLVRNYLSRAPHRVREYVSEDNLLELAANDPDPAEQASWNQAMGRLSAAMSELPEDMRSILMLVAVEELSYEEAATLLSIPVGTVRSRVSRARTTLRKRLADAGCTIDF